MNFPDFNWFLEWFNMHSSWLAPAVGITSFLESLLLMGLLVPGVLMLFALSTIAGILQVNIVSLLVWGFVGAFLGDSISFWIGCKFKYKITEIKIFKCNPNWLITGEKFFNKYGPFSISLGRFIGPIRPFIPTVAGMLGMDVKQFYIINLLSSIPWALAYILPGYYAASLIETLYMHLFYKPILTLMAIVLIAFGIAYLVNEIIFFTNNRIKNIHQRWLLSLMMVLLAVLIQQYFVKQYNILEHWLHTQQNYVFFVYYAEYFFQIILLSTCVIILVLLLKIKNIAKISKTNYTFFALSFIMLLLQTGYFYSKEILQEISINNRLLGCILLSINFCLLLRILFTATNIKITGNQTIDNTTEKILYILVLTLSFINFILAPFVGLIHMADLLVVMFLGWFYSQTITTIMQENRSNQK